AALYAGRLTVAGTLLFPTRLRRPAVSNSTDRILTALVLIAGGLAVAMAVRPDWITGQQAAAAGSATLLAPPDDQAVRLARRMRMKATVVRQLLGGELTLLDAAAAFRILNDAQANDDPWRAFQGGSDGEKLCRQVIYWADAQIRFNMRPSDVEAKI